MKVQPERKPSKEKPEYWLFAERKVGSYPEHTERGGKWLIFVPSDAVDDLWQKIRLAVEQGRLGGEAEVSTAKPNPNATDPSERVICVYTYDAADEADCRQVRSSLRDLGITWKIPYKPDAATFRCEYAKYGDKHISLYYE